MRLFKARTKPNRHIADGVALLDEHYPGWVDEIDLHRLSLYSPEDCILGQLYGRYIAGLEALGIKRGTLYGFIPVGTPELNANRWARYISGARSAKEKRGSG